MLKTTMIKAHYQIELHDLALRYFRIHARFSVADASKSYCLQQFGLPAWIPGSYMIRDFAKHVVAVKANAAGEPLPIQKISPHIWKIAHHTHTEIELVYTVFANDASIRGAYLGFDRAFWNHTSLCVHPVDFALENISVEIAKPTQLSGNVSTALTPINVDSQGFGLYYASNYDELIDHPVEISDGIVFDFMVHQVPHQVVLSGDLPIELNIEQIKQDLQTICTTQAKLFDPQQLEQLAFDRYIFLTHVRDQAYGGLEHRNSTALLCSPDMLPTEKTVDANTNKAYRQFLGLCSHEYFHTWHVKRLKPKAFIPYHLNQVVDTSLLWVFEGFTAYFDDWILQQAGIISTTTYLEILAKTWESVINYQGHREQSLHDASVDAWIKYYKPDENSQNATVSYYTKGALLAACIDILLRIETQGKIGLCDVLITLWSDNYSALGNHQAYVELGVERSDLESALLMHLPNAQAQQKMIDLLACVNNTAILPFELMLSQLGLSLEKTLTHLELGARLNDQLTLIDLYANTPAHRAGLTHGDRLLSVGNQCVQNKSELEKTLSALSLGAHVQISFRRNGKLERANIELNWQKPQFKIKQATGHSDAHNELLHRWLQHDKEES
jgi:predicted metalloprotease with PDZ domain